MKTEFKVFDSDWGYSSIEDSIKEYQEKHHLEIKNVVAIRDKPCEIVVGVLFEKGSEDENKWINQRIRKN